MAGREYAAGDVVVVMLDSWQVQDGARVRLGESVRWNLELYPDRAEELPEVAVTLKAQAEPASYGAGEDVSILRAGRICAHWSPAPLAGEVEVTGILMPDWYDRTHSDLPPTSGQVTGLDLISAQVERHTDRYAVVPGTVRFRPIQETSLDIRDPYDAPLPVTETDLGVRVMLLLE